MSYANKDRAELSRLKHETLKFSNKKKQWLWFVALWCGGLAAMFLLAAAARWLVKL